jgi:hypothetical protein
MLGRKKDNQRVIHSTQMVGHFINKDAEKEAENQSAKDPQRQAALTIVNYYINASECDLLQLVKLPKSMAFDIAYDVMQSSILDEQRKLNRIPLKTIFREAWLMAMRGAEGKLADSVYSTGQAQVENDLRKPTDVEEHFR